jgi:hypothetical protein
MNDPYEEIHGIRNLIIAFKDILNVAYVNIEKRRVLKVILPWLESFKKNKRDFRKGNVLERRFYRRTIDVSLEYNHRQP